MGNRCRRASNITIKLEKLTNKWKHLSEPAPAGRADNSGDCHFHASAAKFWKPRMADTNAEFQTGDYRCHYVHRGRN
jgi:hypothetical protein